MKLKLIKKKELAIHEEIALYCDFCGENQVMGFTSTFDDRKDGDERKCEMQICRECIYQLFKLIK
jgi:hypothetical protein